MPNTAPRDRPDLPIQPTGSGVADTDIAMMQTAVEDADALAEPIDPDAPTRTQA